ncbi:MAG: sigma-70 family RNA polymerase sigma factor [Verrucomicrobiota bacterium]
MSDSPVIPPEGPEDPVREATRGSLLSRLKDWEDDRSWRDFFETYWRLIHVTALKAGLTQDEAQEVVQETVICVAKNLPQYKADPKRGPFRAWLLHTVRWRIGDQFRKRKRHGVHEPHRREDGTGGTDTLERIPDPGAAASEEDWNREWEETLLETALGRVKSRVKPDLLQIFQLLAFRRIPARQVARRLRVTLARVYYARYTVGAQVRRELKRLREQDP